MNLKAEIASELWNNISRSYESELYKSAILDAIHYLSDILRERADLTGDGVQLVGQALGGNSPKLRVNKLQTQSEKDEQKGLEQLLRGLYQGIRNPRSHEKIEDTKETADAIVLFINFVSQIVGQAPEVFTINSWSELISDPDFVRDEQYVKLLIDKIPSRKRFDTLITLYRNKENIDQSNLQLVINQLIPLLDSVEVDDFLREVSDELKTVKDVGGQFNTDYGTQEYLKVDSTAVVRTILALLPSELWLKIERIAKLRIENKLINSIESGTYSSRHNKCLSGSLGTWSRPLIRFFEESSKKRLLDVFVHKLKSSPNEREYISKFFFWELPDAIFDKAGNSYQKRRVIESICIGLINSTGDETIRDRISHAFINFPEGWSQSIEEELSRRDKSVYDVIFGSTLSDDDIPF